MIFFDFDGTIVNVWSRYYQVFLAASEFTGISQRDYVKAKRTLISDREVAHHLGRSLPAWYFLKKRALLESEDYLRLDTLFVSEIELNAMFSKFECRFLTERRQVNAFFTELKNLGLSHLSDQAIVLDPAQKVSKKEFLMQNFPHSNHIVIGDSAAEWETAALENVHAVLVQTGLRQPEDFPLSTRHTVVPSVSVFIRFCMERELQL